MVVNLSTCRWIERCFLWRRARIASLEASDLCVLWRQLSVIWMSASQCLNLYFPSNLSALILKVHSAFLFLSYTVCAVSSHFFKTLMVHVYSCMFTVFCSSLSLFWYNVFSLFFLLCCHTVQCVFCVFYVFLFFSLKCLLPWGTTHYG